MSWWGVRENSVWFIKTISWSFILVSYLAFGKHRHATNIWDDSHLVWCLDYLLTCGSDRVHLEVITQSFLCQLLNQSGPWSFVWSPLLDVNCKNVIFLVCSVSFPPFKVVVSFEDNKPAVWLSIFFSINYDWLQITFLLCSAPNYSILLGMIQVIC